MPQEESTRAPSPRVAPLSNRTIAVIGVALLSVAVACGVTLPWLFGGDVPANRTRLEAIRVAGTLVVGAGGVIALWLAARRQRSTELELSRQYDADRVSELDAAERRITELYTKAADQLGSDKAPVRLAGLYALERVGSGAADQRPTIANVICAYLRMPYTPPPTRPPSDEDTPHAEAVYQERIQEQQVRLTAQRILHRRLTTVISPTQDSQRWPGLTIDLTGAELRGIQLGRTDLSDATFVDTKLSGATFTAATLDHTDFTRADLSRADLESVQSTRADFTGADLTGAVLTRATLREACLRDARLTGADVSGADFTGATLDGAELGSMVFSDTTRWPTEALRREAMSNGQRDDAGYRTRPDWRPGTGDA